MENIMFKKLAVAATLAMSFTAVADPILLPGGVSVPDPVEPSVVNGTGNVVTTLNFLQYFQDQSGNLVNLETAFTGDFSDFVGFQLTGFGTLTSGSAGEFLCPSCTLAFNFGGLSVIETTILNPFTGQPQQSLTLNPDGSFFDLYIIDEYSGSLPGDFASTDRLSLTAGAAGFIDEINDTLFMSGSFSELEYSPEISVQNLSYGGLLDGELVAGIDIADPAPGEGIANGNIVSNQVTQEGLTDFFDAVAFSLSSTFQAVNGDIITIAQGNAGNLSTNVVPAPATLGVFGLALAGMGFLRRRK